jgi:hypothetical protein
VHHARAVTDADVGKSVTVVDIDQECHLQSPPSWLASMVGFGTRPLDPGTLLDPDSRADPEASALTGNARDSVFESVRRPGRRARYCGH